MFGEEALCSSFECTKAIWKEVAIFKVNQKTLMFLNLDLQISERQEKSVFSGPGSQISAAFLLLGCVCLTFASSLYLIWS